MNAFFIFLGALALLLAGLAARAVGGMQDEIRTRLPRIPYAVLRLAALLVPADQRDDLRAEWQSEVSGIFEETKETPFTGLVRTTRFALGLLARGRAVARGLDGTAGHRRRQLLDLLTRAKHGARGLAGRLGGSGTRRPVMTVSTPAGTTTVTGRAALAATAALAAAAAGITASVLAGTPPGPVGPGGVTGAGLLQGPVAAASGTASTTAVPAGFHTVTVSAATLGSTAGFTLAVPDGWSVHTQGAAMFAEAPGGNTFLQVDLTPHTFAKMLPEAHYLADLIQQQGMFPGYHELGIDAADIRGSSGAAWGFTWHNPDVGPVRTLDLLYIAPTPAGQQSYALYMSAPTASWRQHMAAFDEEMRTFQPVY